MSNLVKGDIKLVLQSLDECENLKSCSEIKLFTTLQIKYESARKYSIQKVEIIHQIQKETPNNPYYYYLIPRCFKLDMEITLFAISLLSFRFYKRIMQAVPKQLKQNKEFAKKMIQQTNGHALYHLDETIRNDKELVLLVLKNTGWAHFSAVSTKLKYNLEIIKQAAIVHRSYTAKFIPDFTKLLEDLGFSNRFEFWRHVLGNDYIPAKFTFRYESGYSITVIA